MSDFAKASALFGINKFEEIVQRVFYCNIRFHWKKIGLEILLVNCPTVCLECKGIKYRGCRR